MTLKLVPQWPSGLTDPTIRITVNIYVNSDLDDEAQNPIQFFDVQKIQTL